MKRPLVVAALAWMVGTVFSHFCHFGLWVALFTLFFALVCFDLSRRRREDSPRWPIWVLCFGLAAAGYLRSETAARRYEEDLERTERIGLGEACSLRGTLDGAFLHRGDYWVAGLDGPEVWQRGQWRSLPGRVELVAAAVERPRGSAGDVVCATGSWRSPSRPTLPGELDWRMKGQSSRSVGCLFVAPGVGTLLWEESRLTLWFRIVRLRDSWRTTISDWMVSNLSPEGGSLALTMTTGDRTALPPGLRKDLVRSGLYHLTAISGLHVTALLVSFPWCLKLFGIRRRWRALLGLPLGFFLLFLVGGRIPVIRAALMGMALMLGTFLDRPSQGLNLLGGAALFILLLFPSELWQPGFQLSFLIVASLLVWGWKSESLGLFSQFEHAVQNLFPPTGLIARVAVLLVIWISKGLWTSLVATAAGAPLTAFHFHQIAWSGILANLVGVPLAAAIAFLGMLATFAATILPLFGDFIRVPLGFCSDLLVAWTKWVASQPAGFSPVLRPDPAQISLIFAALLLLRFPRSLFPGRILTRRAAVLVVLAIISWWPATATPKAFRLTFLDVGQGDAILLRFPRGENLLVDTGPPTNLSPGRPSRLGAALRSLGVRKLHGVVITHPELDHCGGLPALLAEVPVERIFCTGDVNVSDSFRELARIVDDTRVPVERLLAGDRLSGIGDATLSVLSPTAAGLLHRIGETNDRSLVFLVEQAGLKCLFTGDIGEETELEIIDNFPDLRAEILKVAHHGSRSSSSREFLERVSPRIAVVSCGENPFGHPHPEVLSRLQDLGCMTYATWTSGSLDISWQEGSLRIVELAGGV